MSAIFLSVFLAGCAGGLRPGENGHAAAGPRVGFHIAERASFRAERCQCRHSSAASLSGQGFSGAPALDVGRLALDCARERRVCTVDRDPGTRDGCGELVDRASAPPKSGICGTQPGSPGQSPAGPSASSPRSGALDGPAKRSHQPSRPDHGLVDRVAPCQEAARRLGAVERRSNWARDGGSALFVVVMGGLALL